MLDREGHGHKAVLYKSQFPPLRHSFRQRHRCIHRLINHVYTKDQTLCYSLPHDNNNDTTLIHCLAQQKKYPPEGFISYLDRSSWLKSLVSGKLCHVVQFARHFFCHFDNFILIILPLFNVIYVIHCSLQKEKDFGQ